MQEYVLSNARIVLEDEVVEGSLVVRDGRIAEIGSGASAVGDDMGGDYVIPGLVELHTDHFENHYAPRPGVTWNAMAAIMAHDAQIAGAGITTVFDAIRIGSDPETGDRTMHVAEQVEAVERAVEADMLRASHYIHLRCELPSADVYQHFAQHCAKPIVRLASLMDHTPGARQYTTLEHYIIYYQKRLRLTDQEMQDYIATRMAEQAKYSDANRRDILRRGHEVGLAFASHDDATAAHVAEAVENRVAIAEFPTTVDAAKLAHGEGLAVLMGAPNVVRGGSHNGNVSASALAEAGVLDVLSSDYVPYALMQAAFLLPERVESMSLPEAVAKVTANPARAAGLADRGSISVGKRADLVRIEPVSGLPVVRSVWREGRRVS